MVYKFQNVSELSSAYQKLIGYIYNGEELITKRRSCPSDWWFTAYNHSRGVKRKVLV